MIYDLEPVTTSFWRNTDVIISLCPRRVCGAHCEYINENWSSYSSTALCVTCSKQCHPANSVEPWLIRPPNCRLLQPTITSSWEVPMHAWQSQASYIIPTSVGHDADPDPPLVPTWDSWWCGGLHQAGRHDRKCPLREQGLLHDASSVIVHSLELYF